MMLDGYMLDMLNEIKYKYNNDVFAYCRDVCRRRKMESILQDNKISADSFVKTVIANANNERMDDSSFRAFIRNTLPIVYIDEV